MRRIPLAVPSPLALAAIGLAALAGCRPGPAASASAAEPGHDGRDSPAASSRADGAPPVDCDDALRRLGEAAHAGDWLETERRLAALRAAGEAAGPALVLYLERRLDAGAAAAASLGGEAAARHLEPLLVAMLGDVGGGGSVRALVRCAASRGGDDDTLWSDCAQALGALTARAIVTRHDLAPLLESGDPALAAFGEDIWRCVGFEHAVPEARLEARLEARPEALASQDSEIRLRLADLGGSVDSIWHSLAEERGSALSATPGGDDEGKLRALFADAEKRIAALRAEAKAGSLGWYETMAREARERLVQIRALDELIARTGRGAAELLVRLVEEGGDPWASGLQGMSAEAAGYRLYRLTGRHFPLTCPATRGNLSTSLSVCRGAARAWRRVLADPAAAAPALPPEPQALARERRLADFERVRHSRSGGEFDRPTGELVAELIASDERRILAMLTEALRERTLAANDVERLVQAAREDRSEAHRVFLIGALYSTRAEPARRYLEESLGKGAAEADVVAFLREVKSVPASEAALLTRLYSWHDSAAVRNEVSRLAGEQTPYGEEDGRDHLLTWLAENAAVETHRAAALRSLYQRSGVNAGGRELARRRLREDPSPAVREAIYQVMLEREPDAAIAALVADERSGTVRLQVIRRASQLLGDERLASRLPDERTLAHLRRLAEGDPEEPVRAGAQAIVAELRRRALRELLERGPFLCHGHDQAALAAPAEQAALARQALESLERRLASGAETDAALAGLAHRFGDLPAAEAEPARRALEAARSECLGKVRETLSTAPR